MTGEESHVSACFVMSRKIEREATHRYCVGEKWVQAMLPKLFSCLSTAEATPVNPAVEVAVLVKSHNLSRCRRSQAAD